MSASGHASPSLPETLRGLRVGIDDERRIRRTVHLAAAKIEDLELRLSRLAAELETAASPGPRRPDRRTPRRTRGTP